MEKRHVVAVDLGASSGRVSKVGYEGETFKVEEVHRFSNVPVWVGGSLQWDINSIWAEVSRGVDEASKGALSIGVDTWGVDFALLDSEGSLLGNPFHYWDERTAGMMDWVFERVPRREIFERTGNQFISLNTLYQIASLVSSQNPILKKASRYL